VASPDEVLSKFGEGIAAGLVGFLSALATFRSRFAAIEITATAESKRLSEVRALEAAAIERRFDAIESLLAKEHDERKAYRKDMQRRQFVMLRILADLANKEGLKNRLIDDALTNLITSDDAGGE
jgi:hypothetical protein